MVNLDTTDASERFTLDHRLDERSPQGELAQIRDDLLRDPPQIAARYFYDDRGSRLFEALTELPEYYQTRTERALLESIADEVVEITEASELVELGSGAATKTRILLDAMERSGRLELYVPFDVNEYIVRRSADELMSRYRDMRVHGVVGEFTHHLGHIPEGGRRLVIFLGGTIGNFRPAQALSFLTDVASEMAPGDFLLLGTDLIKEHSVLEAAYNDSQGVTAAFNRNILRVVNRKAGGDFDPEAFTHRACFNEPLHRIEMWLRSARDQVVRLEAIHLEIGFPEGRQILTEISVKYDQRLVEELLSESGFELRHWYTDPRQQFALSLAQRL